MMHERRRMGSASFRSYNAYTLAQPFDRYIYRVPEGSLALGDTPKHLNQKLESSKPQYLDCSSIYD